MKEEENFFILPNSDKINHNCMCCNDNCFPFTESGTNGYDKTDINNNHLNWYFNETNKFFDLCNSALKLVMVLLKKIV